MAREGREEGRVGKGSREWNGGEERGRGGEKGCVMAVGGWTPLFWRSSAFVCI